MKKIPERRQLHLAKKEPHKEGIPLRMTAAVTKEDKWYVARCLEVEVTSQGASMEEAMVNLREALELYFEDVEPIAPYASPIIAPLDVEVRT